MVGRILVRGLLRPDMWSQGLDLTMAAACSTLDLDRARPSHTPRKPGSGLTSPSRPIWPTCRAVAGSERNISATWVMATATASFACLGRTARTSTSITTRSSMRPANRCSTRPSCGSGLARRSANPSRSHRRLDRRFSRIRDLTVPVPPGGGSFAWPMPGCAVRRGSSRRLDGGAGQETDGKLDGVCILEPLVVRQ